MKERDYEHIIAQRSGKKRDNYVCQICGSRDHAEGHHIFDVFFSGAANDDNIITLCHDCHQKAHNGLIDIFKF